MFNSTKGILTWKSPTVKSFYSQGNIIPSSPCSHQSLSITSWTTSKFQVSTIFVTSCTFSYWWSKFISFFCRVKLQNG